MRLTYLIIILLYCVVFSPGCNGKKSQEPITAGIMDDVDSIADKKVKLIFYNMYLPTEMSRLFERVGANYTPDILNSADNFSRYSSSEDIAFNIGIYGVDLSYCMLFSQNAATAKYFSTIQILYEKLGIPNSYYENLVKSLEKNYNDRDSLVKFASDVFEKADSYLRKNQSDANAAMIITGGWIEALYIAGKIAERNPENFEIRERIASQKYSLNSLISLLSNYQENIKATETILMLKELKRGFDKIEIFYSQESLKVDTVKKFISASDYKVNISQEIMNEILDLTGKIRSEIVY